MSRQSSQYPLVSRMRASICSLVSVQWVIFMLRRLHSRTAHPLCRWRKRKFSQATQPSALLRKLPRPRPQQQHPPSTSKWPEAVRCTRTGFSSPSRRCTVSTHKNKVQGFPVVIPPRCLGTRAPLPIHVSCCSVSSKLIEPPTGSPPTIAFPTLSLSHTPRRY